MSIESDLKDVIEERESSVETEEEEDETSFKNSSPVVSNVSISSQIVSNVSCGSRSPSARQETQPPMTLQTEMFDQNNHSSMKYIKYENSEEDENYPYQ